MKTEKFITLTESCLDRQIIIESTETGVLIRNVKVLGCRSKNGREYTEMAMRSGAPLYEGVQCFLNHITPEEIKARTRFVENLAGRFTNPRYVPQDRETRADINVLKDDPAGNKLVAIAQQMPEIAGFSHNAQGKMHVEDGIEIIEEIEAVYSVDLVTSPATTNGIFEQEKMEVQEMDWSKLNIDDLKINRKDIYEALLAKGAESRDEEVKKLKEAKEAAVKESDELKVKESIRQKEADVAKAIKDSELPDNAVTEVFRAQLLEAKPENVAKLIGDRKELVANAQGGVKGMGEGKQEDKGKDLKKVSESLDF
jgi:hypothetical protein